MVGKGWGGGDGRGGVNAGVGEAIPDMEVEVRTLGLSLEQILIGPLGNTEVMINGATEEFQFQAGAMSGAMVPIGGGLEQAGVQNYALHKGYALRVGKVRGLPHTARG